MKQGRSYFTRRSVPYASYERFDNENERLFLHRPSQKSSSSKSGLTALEAAWNVTNAIQVRFFVSKIFKKIKSVSFFRGCFWLVYPILSITEGIGHYLQ